MKAKEWFIDAAKGTSLGFGILPGVSVGTVGLIVNVYDKLLGSINGLRKNFVKSFLTLLPIALGCIISVVVLLVAFSFSSGTLSDGSSYNVKTIVIFALAGSVLGCTPIILKEFRGVKLEVRDWLRIAVGFVIAAGIGVFSVLAYINKWFNFDEAFLDPNANWWVYIATPIIGFIAAVACLIPGISGSMVLFIFGLYEPVVAIALGDQSVFHNQTNLVPRLILLLTLFIGVVVGLFAISKAMATLLEKHHRGTYDYVVGFIFGSIVSMFVNNTVWEAYEFVTANSQWWQFVVGGVLFLLVAALMAFLTIRMIRKSESQQYTDGEIKTEETK